MSLRKKIKALFKGYKNSDQELIKKTQEIIGYTFRDESLLILSLTHRSFTRATNVSHPANERLEFLGDSVLGMVISHKLFEDHPELREGELTKIKAMMVNETTLSNIGKKIGLNQCILMSPEEERSGGRERPSIISDAFESVLGAVFLDGNLNPARDVILHLLYTNKIDILSDISQKNYKGELLEAVQAMGEGMPRYDVVSEEGPDHDKTFNLEVIVSNKKIGQGSGFTKKEAEQKAAAMALQYLKK